MRIDNMANPKFLEYAITLLLFSVLLTGFNLFSPSWKSINNSINKKYPDVPSISTDALVELLKTQEVILIDVREAEEYAVSTLKGAINIQSVEDITAAYDAEIIVFCSVGYRSAEFASQLREAGYANVLNVRGSIFEWANKGYPLYRGSSQTQFVHPYNTKWGKLLDSQRHSYRPVPPTLDKSQ